MTNIIFLISGLAELVYGVGEYPKATNFHSFTQSAGKYMILIPSYGLYYTHYLHPS
jgi:hypothetical protein